jgi:sugar lactone lactonase YvrE
LALILVLAWCAPAPASTLEPLTGCTAAVGSGQRDSAGNLYVACDDDVQIYNATGVLTSTVELGRRISDVAPNGDGSLLYVTTFDLTGGDTPVLRYRRQLDGMYTSDSSWSSGAIGSFIVTDANGYLYAAQRDSDLVSKYKSDGSLVTTFGGATVFSGLSGVAVSRDGRTAYTTEVGNHRVQRWSRRNTGMYRSVWRFGTSALSAPQDIGVDSAGDVYVANSGRSDLVEFSSLGTVLATTPLPSAPVGLSVASNGGVLIPSAGIRVVTAVEALPPAPPPTSPTPPPAPTPAATTAVHPPAPPIVIDRVAPRISSVGSKLRIKFNYVSGLFEHVVIPIRVSERSTAISTLTLPMRAALKRGGKRRPAQILGRGRTSISGGKRASAVLVLNYGGRKYLRRAPRRQKLLLRVTVRDASGNSRTATRRIYAGSVR